MTTLDKKNIWTGFYVVKKIGHSLPPNEGKQPQPHPKAFTNLNVNGGKAEQTGRTSSAESRNIDDISNVDTVENHSIL